MELIEKLNLLMRKKNIRNLSQLSREADIPYTTLKSIFDGDVNDIRLSTSRKLCSFFNITLDELLDDDISLEKAKTSSSHSIDTQDLTKDETEELKQYKEFLKQKRNNLGGDTNG